MKWINVKTDLPENKQMCLVSIPDEHSGQNCHVAEFNIDEYSGNHRWETINSDNPAYTLYATIVNVSHWMPLPDKP